MKKTILVLTILIINITILKSQTEENKSGFYDLKLSYVVSSKGIPGSLNYNFQTIIPYGLGLSSTYKFNRIIYAELGIIYKTEGKQNESPILMITDPTWLYAEMYHEYTHSYIDLPLQLHFNFIKCKSFRLMASAGLKGTMFIYKDYWNPNWEGKIDIKNGKEYGIAYYFGLMEYYDLTSKIGIFATQNYGRYFNNEHNNYRYAGYNKGHIITFDFKIGLSYKLK